MEVKKMNTYVDNLISAGMMTLENVMSVKQDIHGQEKSRTSIDSVICHQLDGSALKEALFIIDNIEENRMKIRWSSPNVWSVHYGRKHVCDLSIKDNSLVIGQLSEALITRVKDKSRNKENMMQLIDAMLNAMPREQEAYALQ